MTTQGDLLKRLRSPHAIFEGPPKHIRRGSMLSDLWNHLRDRWLMSRVFQPLYCDACKQEHAKAVRLWSLWGNSKDTYIGRRFLPYGADGVLIKERHREPQ